ncbi:MAG: hypothetical protein ACOVVP_16065, partial [Pseudanabaena sp.]
SCNASHYKSPNLLSVFNVMFALKALADQPFQESHQQLLGRMAVQHDLRESISSMQWVSYNRQKQITKT